MTLCTCSHTEAEHAEEHLKEFGPLKEKACSQCFCPDFTPILSGGSSRSDTEIKVPSITATGSEVAIVSNKESPYPCDQIDWSDYAPDETLDNE